jgi:hypothetical protein
MQRQYQTVENRDVVDERSIVEADFYAKRFKEFLFERVFHPADDELPTTSSSFHYPPITNNQNTSSRSSIYPQISSFNQ